MASADKIGVEDVLHVLTDIYGLNGEIRKNEFHMLCPVHSESDPSCDVNLKSGYWNCFSCKGGGDLIALGKIVLKRSRKEVRTILKPNEPTAIVAAVQRRSRANRSALGEPMRAKRRKLADVPPRGSYSDGPLKEMEQRGFTLETLEKWGVRYAKRVALQKESGEFFNLTHAICIPIMDESGKKTLGWCHRATQKSDHWFREVRYIYTPGITDTISETWFGLDHHGGADEIMVTEGAIDAMWLDQNGFPALAVLGSNVKQAVKIRKLMRYKRVTLVPDKDKPGVWAAWYLGQALYERGVPCNVARYASWMKNRRGDPAKDANDLCPLDLELAVERAIPYLSWKRGVQAPPSETI